MSEKTKVFISYARKDEAMANAMVLYFEAHDIRCFIDKRDILPSTNYAEEIINGIERSDVVVLILTQESNRSDNVRNEIDNALNLKKKIIVFRIENIALSRSLQFYLASCQWFDAFSYRGEEYFGQLADVVKGLPVSPFSPGVIRKKKLALRSLQLYALLSLAAFLILGIPVLKDYAVVNRVNPRGVRFADAIRMSGLSDIESKKWGRTYHIAAPTDLYINARREIFVSGVTLHTTLEQHREFLRDALERGVKIRLLLLHPASPDSFVVNTINKRAQSYTNAMAGSLSIIRSDSAMFTNRNMEVRFADHLPPLIGILIDGDIQAEGAAADSGGIIRVSPYFRSPKHNDWYFQFSRSNAGNDAFMDFAAEYRSYWKNARPYKEVIL